MKGYTNVNVADIKSAIKGWNYVYEQGKVARDKGIELYYEKFYTNGSWLTKYLNRKLTKIQFVRARVPMFSGWTIILDKFLTEDEYDSLETWCHNIGKNEKSSLESLMGASESGDILLDDNLCYFIVKYKGAKNYE